MEEKILKGKKNGMKVLLAVILVYVLDIALFAVSVGHVESSANPLWIAMLVVSILIFFTAWIFLCGLKVLKPQEALVLTLFGKYVGTLKENGFYYVNPFCTSVNPAAKTRLNQSGDVSETGNLSALAVQGSGVNVTTYSNKLSLKIMTLNNSRQKINDCLGNPIEIGIAVTWPCGTWSASTLTTYLPMWTPPATA